MFFEENGIKPISGSVQTRQAAGCICTKSVLDGKTPLTRCVRHPSVGPLDNGWRFTGRDDDEAYVNRIENSAVVDFSAIAEIEPAVAALCDLPVGTDIRVEYRPDGIHFFENSTGREITESVLP